ncbi:alpha-L-fucosidase [Fulvivirgaceae bacterium BMA10]|uniref:alpha-L-fucosidase n=2 Tax=Splendidivirga corallicola TaxID=3051826 RepID=A0ABT8KPL3_9BACT|nr:alpha-L-fucosidase [Fulvivirgaceae bacterium BMA10]
MLRFSVEKLLILALLGVIACVQTNEASYSNLVDIEPHDSEEVIIEKAANVAPSARQLAWQKLELTGFLHFGVNTFTDMEWGHGDEDPAIFNPTELDARQWVKVCKEAGMKLLIITAKHHDGFCLWPSKYTEHSVKNSPWKDGKGDVVQELAEACREMGMKLGVYLSPWDRHEQTYGTDAYNDYFVNQLTELLTNYGKIDEVWFDGANGEGPNGKKQVYDWERFYSTVRKLQPEAVIAVAGPDVRWVGTESGYGRSTEWSVVPANNKDQDEIAARSQQEAGIFRPQIDAMAEDLGSRDKILSAKQLAWYPSEVDVSIRPGWFYHKSQDNQVKTPEKLLDIYYSSVGKNSLLLLNIPPDKRGLIHENDVATLKGWRSAINATFEKNLLEDATVSVIEGGSAANIGNILDLNDESYWLADDNAERVILEIDLDKTMTFDRALLQEQITIGQRVEKFSLEAWLDGAWNEIARETTIGYKRLLRFDPVTTDKIRLIIHSARTNPAISSLGLFKSPPSVSIEPAGGVFIDDMTVILSSDDPAAKIRYTLDGSEPNEQSAIYEGPIVINKAVTLKAYAYIDNQRQSFVKRASFNQSKYGITLKNSFSEKYTAGGNLALTDGLTGSNSYGDDHWQGYEGDDLDAIIDLGSTRKINAISVNFLQDTKGWIFGPNQVIFSISEDGKSFTEIFRSEHEIPVEDQMVSIQTALAKTDGQSARYIQVLARNIGVCPAWHPGDGSKAWLFVDEITIK